MSARHVAGAAPTRHATHDRTRHRTRLRTRLGAAALIAWALLGPWAAPAAQAEVSITMWVHAREGAEFEAYQRSVERFNGAQRDVRLSLYPRPAGDYGEQLEAAGEARRLPCLLDVDGPSLYTQARRGRIVALDAFPALVERARDMLPSLQRQGRFDGHLYSLAQYDSGLAIWGNRRLLQAAGVRIPQRLDEAWSLAEFEQVLAALRQSGVPTPLDMKFNYGVSEWYTYGFSPIVQSLGGDLIDRSSYRRASGHLNGPAAVRALGLLQGWARQGYIDPGARDDTAFTSRRSALSYAGHWVYPAYRAALGDDLVLIPAVRFGERAATGAGSWNFAISADCRHPREAAEALAFLTSPDEILQITAANGAVPATAAALARSTDYGPGGPLRLYVSQIEAGVAVMRPETEHYPLISALFARAVRNALDGGDPQRQLGRAAFLIDEAIATPTRTTRKAQP